MQEELQGGGHWEGRTDLVRGAGHAVHVEGRGNHLEEEVLQRVL